MSLQDKLKHHEVVLGEQYRKCEKALPELHGILKRHVTQLSLRIQREAARDARGDAFSLKAILRNKPARFVVWALMLCWPFLFSSIPFSFGIFFYSPFLILRIYWFVFLVYGLMVHAGFRKRVKQLIGGRYAVLQAFSTRKICLLYIDRPVDARVASSPFSVVRAPWDGAEFSGEMAVRGLTGELNDTVWLAMLGTGEGDTIEILLRIPEDGKAVKIEVYPNKNKLSEWQTCERLLTEMAPDFVSFADPIRTLGIHVAAWKKINAEITALARQEAQRKAEEDRQRQAMVAKMEKWNTLALKPELSEKIIKIIRHFISGAKPAMMGVLLYGPPGTGKTTIAKHMAEFAGCHCEVITLADLKGKHLGHTAPMVTEVWKRCRSKAPTLLVLDECEGIFPRRGSVDTDSFSQELVQTFLQQWDGMNSVGGQVLVVGLTNRRETLDDAVVQRFTMAYEISLPDAAARMKILGNELKVAGIQMELTELVVKETSGMSGRDLSSSVRMLMTRIETRAPELVDLLAAIREIRGRSSTQVSDMGWDDIVISEELRETLENLGHNMKDAEKLKSMGIQPPGGALLYGPPGTGKTQIARVLASQSGLSFLAAGTADLKANFLGQSGGKVKELFQKARTMAPCILFLDEIDIIAPARDGDSVDRLTSEIVGQLLQELDGISSRKGQVFLLCASNFIDRIDSAILQRLEEKIEVKLPDCNARAAILALELKNKPLSSHLNTTIDFLAEKTDGWSGRQLSKLVLRASNRALNRVRRQGLNIEDLTISLEDFEISLQKSESA